MSTGPCVDAQDLDHLPLGSHLPSVMLIASPQSESKSGVGSWFFCAGGTENGVTAETPPKSVSPLKHEVDKLLLAMGETTTHLIHPPVQI